MVQDILASEKPARTLPGGIRAHRNAIKLVLSPLATDLT
jgi:hypothetical protein